MLAGLIYSHRSLMTEMVLSLLMAIHVFLVGPIMQHSLVCSTVSTVILFILGSRVVVCKTVLGVNQGQCQHRHTNSNRLVVVLLGFKMLSLAIGG